MVKTIVFDAKNPCWSCNYDNNKAFIEMQTRWIYNFIKSRGYVYLDRIYDTFKAYWNPDESNDCIRYGNGINDFMMSWTHLGDNRFEIRIYY